MSESHEVLDRRAAYELEIPGGWSVLSTTRVGDAWAPDLRYLYHTPFVKTAPQLELVRNLSESGESFEALARGGFGQRLRRKARSAVAARRRGKTETFDRPLHDARAVAPGNVAHLASELLPKLAWFRRHDLRPLVVLRENPNPTMKSFVELAGFETHATDATVRGPLVEASSGVDYVYDRHLRDLLADFAPEGGWEEGLPEKVFIPRRGPRGLTRQAEIQSALESRGYVTVYFEDVPLRRQWSLLRSARSVVGVHGAALGNLVFARHAPRVVEIFGAGYAVNCYRAMTHALGGRWSSAFGRLTPEVIRNLDQRQQPRSCQGMPVDCDPEAVLKALDIVEGRAAELPGVADTNAGA